jgi:RNA polymerase sigma-70 factor (ECF subfamily)
MDSAMRLGNVDVERLYRRYGPMVLRRCRNLLKDEETAADAMQETFVQILRHRSTLNARYPSSLLYRIATNTSLNMLRSQRRGFAARAKLFVEAIDERENLEERLFHTWELAEVFLGVEERARQVARMRFLEHKTLAETAREVGLSISGVRKRLLSIRKPCLLRGHLMKRKNS